MNNNEFEQFVLDCGKDILRFCRMTCGAKESGDEHAPGHHAQAVGETIPIGSPTECKKLCLIHINIALEKQKEKICKQRSPDAQWTVSIKWGGRCFFGRRYAVISPESIFLQEEEETVQAVVSSLPERYRLPIYLYYSSNMTVQEIAEKSCRFP